MRRGGGVCAECETDLTERKRRAVRTRELDRTKRELHQNRNAESPEVGVTTGRETIDGTAVAVGVQQNGNR